MVSKLVGATLAAAPLLASSGIAAANDLAARLVGVWRLDASERKYLDGETVKPMGDKPHQRDEVERMLHTHGAMDLSADVGTPADADGKAATSSEHIPIVKEELEVGKRQTEQRYHVRVYPVERAYRRQSICATSAWSSSVGQPGPTHRARRTC